MKNIQNKFLTLAMILSIFACTSVQAENITDQKDKVPTQARSCSRQTKGSSNTQVASSFSTFLNSGSAVIIHK